VIEAASEPKFYIGSGVNVIQALPSILRFWNKLDVTPLSGTKDLCAIAVVPTDNPSSNSRSRTVGAWMRRLTSAYTVSFATTGLLLSPDNLLQARRFGSHSTTDVIQCGWGEIASSCCASCIFGRVHSPEYSLTPSLHLILPQ
jgi:hypothetical protein